jgi:hypothetical protein
MKFYIAHYYGIEPGQSLKHDKYKEIIIICAKQNIISFIIRYMKDIFLFFYNIYLIISFFNL